MVILLTGATGYLGSLLAKKILCNNHKLIVLKRQRSNLDRLKDIKSKILFYDVFDNDCSKVFNDFDHIDVIIHTATNYGKTETRTEVFNSNVSFPLELLKNAILKNCSYFINTDTYFNTNSQFSAYLENYALSKKKFLTDSKALVKKKICYINMILEHTYGAGDSNSKFVNMLISKLTKDEKVIDLTLGEQKRDFIYSDDVVNAFKTVLDNIHTLKKGYIDIPVGSGSTVSIKNFALIAKNILKSKSDINFGALDYRKNEIFSSKADTTILSKLGWSITITLSDGIVKVSNKISKT